MGDTFFCVTGSPRLTLTLTQKPRLRISEPASGSMMLHIYSRWTNHTLRMPSEGRCASNLGMKVIMWCQDIMTAPLRRNDAPERFDVSL